MMGKTNITLGFVSNYCTIKGLHTVGSFVTNSTARTPSISLNDLTGILPDVHVNIARFSDCGVYYEGAELSYNGLSAGFASTVLAIDVLDIHKDVVGLIGNEYSATAIGIGEEITFAQIPYCTGEESSPTFSDKMKYPYFWRPVPSSGLGEHLVQLLKAWKVSRMALIVQSDDDMSQGFAKDIQSACKKHNYAASELTISDARYIFVSGQNNFVASIVYYLGKLGYVGPQHVWISESPPQPYQDPLTVLGHDYFDYIKGFVTLIEYQPSLQNQVFKHMYERTMEESQFSFSVSDATSFYIIQTSYDCIYMMLLGFDKLLKSNASFTPEMLKERELGKYMNWSLFQDLSYKGATLESMVLNGNGDLNSPFQFISFTGQNFSYNFFGQTNLDATNFTYIGEPSLFNGSVPPPDGPPEMLLTEFMPCFQNVTGIIVIAISILCGILSMAAGILVIRFPYRKPIKRSSVLFLMTVAMAILAESASILSQFGPQSLILCKLRVWLQVLGFSVLISSLAAKSYVDYVLCLSRKKVKKSRLHLIVMSAQAIAVLLSIGTLILWTLLGPLQLKIAVLQQDNFYMVTCDASNFKNPYNLLLLIYHGLLLTVCLYMSLISRDADQATNESTFAGLIAISFTLSGVVMIPVIWEAVPGHMSVLMISSTTGVLCLLVLVSIFAPKATQIFMDKLHMKQQMGILLRLRSPTALFNESGRKRDSSSERGCRGSVAARMSITEHRTTPQQCNNVHSLGLTLISFQNKWFPVFCSKWFDCHLLLVGGRGSVWLQAETEECVSCSKISGSEFRLANHGTVYFSSSMGVRFQCDFENIEHAKQFIAKFENCVKLAEKK
ncbi:periplasmic binding protein-like I [Chytriomyces sp. MP71]|nr:periplasmic binding protein-like I [Chytriomyces sp. MP71]